jgi:uncharacterized membrane protein
LQEPDVKAGTNWSIDKRDSASPFSNSASIVIFALIVTLLTGARLWGLTATCLWFDEVFSVHAAKHEWTELFRFVAADIIHPPLFYVLLKVWIGIGGESLLWLRLFPFVTSIVVIVPFLFLCRELRLARMETGLALLLISVNGYLIKYAQEVRMYTLLLFFTVCSLWLFIKFFNANPDRKHLGFLSAINLLLIYTHYYGWLIVAAQLVFLIFWARRRLTDFLISVAVLLLCFSPWVYAVTQASGTGKGLAQNIGWVARPRVSDVVQLFTILNVPFYFRQSSNQVVYATWGLLASLIIFGPPVAALCWRLIRKKKGEHTLTAAKYLILFCTAPLALALIASWLLPHSIWGSRHLIIVAVPYLLLVSIALYRWKSRWYGTTLLLLLGCWLFIAGAGQLIRRGETYVWCAWEQLSEQIVQRQQSPGNAIKVYAFEELIAYHLWFASEESPRGRLEVGLIKGVPEVREDPAYFLPRTFSDVKTLDVSALTEPWFWIAFRDTSFNDQNPPIKAFTDRGYIVGEVLQVQAAGQQAFLVELKRP